MAKVQSKVSSLASAPSPHHTRARKLTRSSLSPHLLALAE